VSTFTARKAGSVYSCRLMSDSHAITPEDFETAEHHVLGGDPSVHVLSEASLRSRAAGAVTERIELRDSLRSRATELTFYEEGVLKVVAIRRGRRARSHSIDLRYLDPVPTMRRYYPKRLFQTALGFAAVAGISALLATFGIAFAAAFATALVTGTTAVLVLGLSIYLSHEKICFHTLHGRARAITLVAGLGSIRRYRKAMPKLAQAIEGAEESIGEDTAIYLRAEMREHYRLRGEGVLTEEDCSESTGRILMHFDDEL
jgi:hypothetical protein